GRLAHRELVELVAGLAPGPLHELLAAEHGRSPEQVEAYLRDAARAPVRSAAPGSDALDQVVAAVAGVEGSEAGLGDRLLQHLIGPFSTRGRAGGGRAVVALLPQRARAPPPELVALCVAIEPGVLGHASFARADAAAAANGLIRFHWPHRPPADH